MDIGALYRGELSLRRLSVLLKYLPAEAVTPRYGDAPDPAWSREAVLLSHLYTALANKPHPWLAEKADTARAEDIERRLARQRERLAGQP